MSGSSDDVPARTRGAVRPPPSLSPGDAPASIDVPRMSPPPPSLEAMVTSAGRVHKSAKPAASSWWVWLLVALFTAVATAYVMR